MNLPNFGEFRNKRANMTAKLTTSIRTTSSHINTVFLMVVGMVR